MRVEYTQWAGRRALMLNNGHVQAIVLPGGGHLAEIRALHDGTLLPNLLWEPPWPTSDPASAEYRRLSERYGGPPAGPFLAACTGHAICLDSFGPPSAKEEAEGIPLHGEAAVSSWQLEPAADGCVMRVELPISQLALERTVRVPRGQAVLLIEECLENRGRGARDVHWVQHVCFGRPSFEGAGSFVEASVDRCRSWPCGYDGGPLLPDNVDFVWPLAPALHGGTDDLRFPFQHAGKGFVAAAHVRQEPAIAWMAALNPQAGCALIYCFRRDDFPWIAIWEENDARASQPWNRSTGVRGMEFGTTPMPLGRKAIHAMGSLFDTPVSRLIDAQEKHYARYVICAAAIPHSLQSLDTVSVSESALTLSSANGKEPFVIAAEGIGEFLAQGAEVQ